MTSQSKLLLLVGDHFIVVTDVQSTCLVRYDEPRTLETRAITVTDISKKPSFTSKHTHCITAILSHIKYAITIDTQTIWTIQPTSSFSLTVNDGQQLTLGGELLNSVVATVSYIDHTISIDSYTTWIVELSRLSSFTTKAVRVGEVSIEDLDTIVTTFSDKDFPIVINSYTIWDD